ncbi:DUF7319 domain-containing protein [Haloferacaceae archaeon DSL9]
MGDSSSPPADEEAKPVDDPPATADTPPADADSAATDDELEALRRAVEEKYDFDNFGPSDMAEMTAEEWDAVFDSETWVTGEELLTRVEMDLKSKIATRDVFGVVERIEEDGERRLAAYSDEGYAVVYPDGSVEGRGTILRDVKPIVALCSMDDYEVSPPPEEYELPKPEDVAEQTGELGNLMLQVIAGMLLLGGLGLLVTWIASAALIAGAMGAIFLVVGVFLFMVVANARLSDRFRAEQYRNRLRAVQLADDERPQIAGGEDGKIDRAREDGHAEDRTTERA